jgi:WXG100 family type VII secretion target
MTRYQVDSETLIGATGSIRTSIGRLEAECTSLSGQLAQLESTWTGPAATAFSAAYNDWKSTEQLVEQNLAALNHALGQAGHQYAEIESANARLFAR